jgi:hypothetical protein
VSSRLTGLLPARLLRVCLLSASLLSAGLLSLPAAAAETAPPPQQFFYSTYVSMAQDYQASQAGSDMLDRLLAPSPQGLVIRFPPGSEARATIHLSSGVLRYVADDRDELRLPDKREWRRDNPRIELSVRPLALALDF